MGQDVLSDVLQVQEARKAKRGMMNWKRMQKKEIESVIKRAKRILN